MLIKLDVREKKIIQEFKNRNLEFKEEQLNLGDILICNDEKILLIIERKSVNDLCSSIMDGRYKEQSYRLSESNTHNHNIIYLIEGDMNSVNKKFKKINSETLQNALITLNVFKGFTVIKSNNVENTVEIIDRLFKKIKKESKPLYYLNPTIKSTESKESTESTESTESNTQIDEYSSVFKTRKKNNITPENINIIMLEQIPDISFKTANVIINKYKTIVNLIKNLNEDMNCLDNLKLMNNDKERKISKKCIENIKKFLINE